MDSTYVSYIYDLLTGGELSVTKSLIASQQHHFHGANPQLQPSERFLYFLPHLIQQD